MVTKIEIKTVFGSVLFSYEKEENSIKATIEEAVKGGADLHGADLHGADLRDADLNGAYLHGAYLHGADLSYADLNGAYLHGADLSYADLHGADLRDADLNGADLHGAYLHGADLSYADLHGAYLRDADLNGAYLHGAYLRDADLNGAYLHGAYLHGADLRDADLNGAYLHGADLRDADLNGAYLRGADLRGADLSYAENVPFIPLSCPSDGAFIGWKKVRIYKPFQIESYLVKLEVPEDARRSSATSNKCRCDKAKVLAITDLEEKETFSVVTNREYALCTYKVGEFVYPDSFDEDRWNECSHGIHFFINKQEAINY